MKDLIQDDPYFSQVDKMVQDIGLEKTREILGSIPMHYYAKRRIAQQVERNLELNSDISEETQK